ncbi:MAG TPA: hypothetical protein DCS23_00725 [Candidatus Yonathbacteria bacterium]|nr:hypothetical protein [Candidatus Yonathbacteria bacterium]
MESNEIAVYRGLGAVRNYGIAVLFALLALNGVTLGALNWIENNELHDELLRYSESLPSPDATATEQTVTLPEDILLFRTQSSAHVGFYETSIGDERYLAYADIDKQAVLMKSTTAIQREVTSFAFALVALYLGELVLLLGWWFFIRSKVREIFEAV